MVTSNDRVFCSLVACDYGIDMKKMPYYMYLMQVAGFEVNYRYTVHTNRIRSHGLSKDINTLISMGVLDNDYELTDKGAGELGKLFVTWYEDETADMVSELVSQSTTNELYVLCVVDIIVMETLEKSGYVGLMSNKDTILRDVRYLCGDVSDETFDDCIGVMRILRERRRGII